MKLKRFIFTFAVLTLLGCTAIAQKEYPEFKPPGDIKLSSILYEFAVSRNPENFAEKHGIVLHENSVQVYIYFDPTASISKKSATVRKHGIVVEKESKDIFRARVPLEELMPLSKEPVVWKVTLPDRAKAQNHD